MTDYAKMSDAELLAAYQRAKAPKAPKAPKAHSSDLELAGLSDAELMAKYQQATDKAILPTVNEMHSDLTFFDRLIVKNLGNDPTASAEYLRKKHPKLKVEVTPDGNIRARRATEKEWRVLDPSGFDLQDVTDVAFDVGAGAVEAAAVAGAGIAGAAGGGVGAIPAAMAAGAGTGAGLEALRQLAGKAAGINKEVSGTDIALSGAFGAIAPAMFGTGAAAQQVAKAGVAQATQRGLLRRGVQKYAPKLGETVSGVSARAINTFANRMPEVLKIEQQGMKDVVTETAEEITRTLKDVETREWKVFESSLKGVPDKVDLGVARKSLEDLHTAALEEAKEIRNPAAQKFAVQIKRTMDDIFPPDVGDKINPFTGQRVRIPVPVSPLNAMKVQRRLSDVAKFGKLQPGGTPMVGRLADLTEGQRRIAMAAEEANRTLGSQIGGIAEQYGGLQGKEKYMEMVNLRKSIAKHFKDPQTTYNTLRNIQSPGRQALSETFMRMDEKYGTNLLSKSNLMETVSAFARPTLTALSALGSTSTSRTIPMAAAGAGLGYYLGAQSGLGQGGAGLGLAAGGFLGSVAGGPKALRSYMMANKWAVQNMSKLRDMPGAPVQAVPYSAWNMMTGGQ